MSDEGKLVDAPLPWPTMYQVREHPNALRLMLEQRGRVPQVMQLWVNFESCYRLATNLFRAAVFMEHHQSGMYSFELEVQRMRPGFEPKLTENQMTTLVVPGGAPAAAVAAEEAKKEEEKNGTVDRGTAGEPAQEG